MSIDKNLLLLHSLVDTQDLALSQLVYVLQLLPKVEPPVRTFSCF